MATGERHHEHPRLRILGVDRDEIHDSPDEQSQCHDEEQPGTLFTPGSTPVTPKAHSMTQMRPKTNRRTLG